MVMNRPPAFHVCKFLMKNMIPTNSGLICCVGGLLFANPSPNHKHILRNVGVKGLVNCIVNKAYLQKACIAHKHLAPSVQH